MRSPALVAGGLVLLAFSGAIALASPQTSGPATQSGSGKALSDDGNWPVPRAPKATPTPAMTPTPTPSPPRAVAAAAPNLLAGQFTFAVPIHGQDMNLDCETAALQMALEAMGHRHTQRELFVLMPVDARAPVMGPNKRVIQWGDPYTSYVGNVNGADLIPTGYGVYYPLILGIAQTHGAPNSYGREGFTASEIYAAVRAGHPVEAWTETGWDRPYVGYWTAWDDKQIRYSLIEHAVILSGVSDTQVRVNDPWHGTQYWISKAKFEISWHDFNNMAIVFR